MKEKSIGKYLENGKVELNSCGCERFIANNIKRGEIIHEGELIRRINKEIRE